MIEEILGGNILFLVVLICICILGLIFNAYHSEKAYQESDRYLWDVLYRYLYYKVNCDEHIYYASETKIIASKFEELFTIEMYNEENIVVNSISFESKICEIDREYNNTLLSYSYKFKGHPTYRKQLQTMCKKMVEEMDIV